MKYRFRQSKYEGESQFGCPKFKDYCGQTECNIEERAVIFFKENYYLKDILYSTRVYLVLLENILNCGRDIGNRVADQIMFHIIRQKCRVIWFD